METITIIKIGLMIAFFLEVVIFGKFVSALKCFEESEIMSIAMTFSGALFISIAFLDIIPEAIANLDEYLNQNHPHSVSKNNLHSNPNIPLTMIICLLTFLLIMGIDKLLISSRPEPPADAQIMSDQPAEDEEESQTNWRPFILQAGMSIHAFFECMAVGMQKTTLGVIGLASAILVHKWAEGLTLGLIYQRQAYNPCTINIMIVIQGVINIMGLVVGTIIMGEGKLITGLFMSIAAGTFLYISLGEILIEQLGNFTKPKALSIVIANTFIIFLVMFEKYTEGYSQQ